MAGDGEERGSGSTLRILQVQDGEGGIQGAESEAFGQTVGIFGRECGDDVAVRIEGTAVEEPLARIRTADGEGDRLHRFLRVSCDVCADCRDAPGPFPVDRILGDGFHAFRISGGCARCGEGRPGRGVGVRGRYQDVRLGNAGGFPDRPPDLRHGIVCRVDQIPADEDGGGRAVAQNERAGRDGVEHAVVRLFVHPVDHRRIGRDVRLCRAGRERDF